MTDTIPTATTLSPQSSRVRQRAAVLAAALAAALTLWALAAAATDGPTILRSGAAVQVGPAEVAVSALLGGLAGWGLLAALERLGRNAGRRWTIVSTVVLAVSLGGPLAGGADTASKTVLLLMHLVVGSVVIAGLRRTAGPRLPSN